VRKSAGAELCATHSNPKPNASDCVKAYDQTHLGRVELSDQVKVGEPVQKSALHWTVPYDVVDAAGNAAKTVWRDVMVEEVALANVETKFRNEAMQDKEAEIQVAVKAALEKSEREHKAEIQVQVKKALDRERRGGSQKNTCPECPKCDCSGDFDASKCDSICKSKMESCAISEESFVMRTMLLMEDYLPFQLIPPILFMAAFAIVLMTIRWFFSVAFVPSQYTTYVASDERERAMQNSVTVYHSPRTAMNGTPSASSSNNPVQPGSGNNPSLFSPQLSPQFAQGPVFTSPNPRSGHRTNTNGVDSTPVYEDIYASPEVITPRRRQQGDYRGFGTR
jgi:hypothetical protein